MSEFVEQDAINWLRRKISEFVETLNDSYAYECYNTDRIIGGGFWMTL